MNNLKKTAFALGLGVLSFGFSAFKTKEKRSTLTYYKTNWTHPSPSDPRGYEYYSGDHCETIGDVCSAQWNIGTNPIPSVDGTPLPLTGVTFITNSTIPGHFE